MGEVEAFEQRILAAWHNNAAPWLAAVRGGHIESRRLVTDRAIVDAVLARAPVSAIDIGCGEGWLARELAPHGVAVIGVDTVPELVAAARSAGGGDFRCLSYEEIGAGRFAAKADVVVCNFSLLGKTSVESLFRAMRSLLNPGGACIVQTLHPVTACGDRPYADGWREGSWAGCGSDFREPAPWYFRTFEGWIDLFTGNGLRLAAMREPLGPGGQAPVSVLFIAEVGPEGAKPSGAVDTVE